ncbi:MAG: DUF4422 domain-containing protein [Clostridia bacterium]|nr:DUF4422 domain-containing protein [Clostridia bacterium]
MKPEIKIVVASHKDYPMPGDKIYVPVLAGAALRSSPAPNGFTPDNTGENISLLNPYFCELTGLYWAWNNLDADYIGLVHYRRYFSPEKKADFSNILTSDYLEKHIPEIRIFVPKKRRYYIETLYSHYAHTFDAKHLDTAEQIISEKYPEYSESYRRAVGMRSGYMFNMMIAERSLLDGYCEWLFDILFELKDRIDCEKMDDFQKRFCGRVSEILFNVWLDYKITNNELKKEEIEEIPVVGTEKTNWIKKGSAFLKAKFFGKKYEKSF